jgi:hypothetical protein
MQRFAHNYRLEWLWALLGKRLFFWESQPRLLKAAIAEYIGSETDDSP